MGMSNFLNNECEFDHTVNLFELIWGDPKHQDLKAAKLLCLYFMYKNESNINNTNPMLLYYYAEALCQTGKTRKDYLKAEKFYLLSLSIDDSYAYTHQKYGFLLDHKLSNNEKAKIHYQKAIQLAPDNKICPTNGQ